MISGIYKITNISNSKFYIGSSKNISKRLSDHFCSLKGNYHCNNKLQNSFNKYGFNNFKTKVLATCPPEYLLKLERFIIKSLNPELNLSEVKDINNFKVSEDTKKKISTAASKRKWDDEGKLKLSTSHKTSIKAKEARQKIADTKKIKIDLYIDGVFYSTFPSAKDTAIFLNCRTSSITRASLIGNVYRNKYRFVRNSQNSEKNN